MAIDEAVLIAAAVSNSSCPELSEMPTNPSSLPFSPSDRAEKLQGPVANGLISCSLKRKRPPKIEIPNVLREISTDIFKGCAAVQGQDDGAVCFADSGVGVFSLKGKKKFMEDAHKIFSSSNGKRVWEKSNLCWYFLFIICMY